MIKIEALCTKNEDFDQTYLNTGSKTQNVDLIFHKNFWQNMKSYSTQNFKLRIQSKPDMNQSKLRVCIVFWVLKGIQLEMRNIIETILLYVPL